MIKIKDIVKWEQLSNKSFADIDLKNIDDIVRLLYVTDNSTNVTYGAYKDVFNESPDLFTDKLKEIGDYLNNISQYIKSSKQDKGKENETQNNLYGNMAALLIASGINAQYVMNEMELNEIGVMVESVEKKQRESMEKGRLWTFYNILPHIDAKRIKGPQDIIIFPWEIDKREKTEENNIKEQEEEFLRLQKQNNK